LPKKHCYTIILFGIRQKSTRFCKKPTIDVSAAGLRRFHPGHNRDVRYVTTSPWRHRRCWIVSGWMGAKAIMSV